MKVGEEPVYRYASAVIIDATHAFNQPLEVGVKLNNLDKEKARLEKEIAKKEKDFAVLQSRIDNPNFAKAPALVVEKTKLEFAKISSELEKLNEQVEKL